MTHLKNWPRTAYVAAMVFVISVAAGTSAQAERFQMIELNDDGNTAYLRVDLENGAVSRCVQDENIWQCTAVKERSSDADAALDRRIAELEERVAQLEEKQNEVPDMTEFEEALDMSEQFMQRFFGMVQDLKKDMAE